MPYKILKRSLAALTFLSSKDMNFQRAILGLGVGEYRRFLGYGHLLPLTITTWKEIFFVEMPSAVKPEDPVKNAPRDPETGIKIECLKLEINEFIEYNTSETITLTCPPFGTKLQINLLNRDSNHYTG